jgi:hypothetical protein
MLGCALEPVNEGELGCEQRDRGLRLFKLICKPYQYPCDGRPLPVFGNDCEKGRLYLVQDGHSLRLCIDRVFSDEDLAIPEGRGDVRYWYDVAPQDINWLLPRASDGRTPTKSSASAQASRAPRIVATALCHQVEAALLICGGSPAAPAPWVFSR